LVSRLGVALVACFLTFAPIFASVHAAEDLRKVTVVSFGLFGDQGVFRSEATGAAQIVASRFGGDPVVVKFNTKTGGSATVESLAATLQASTKQMNGESDILFLILTSHGSPHGLAVTAGRLAETLKPSNLAEILDHGLEDAARTAAHFGSGWRFPTGSSLITIMRPPAPRELRYTCTWWTSISSSRMAAD